MKRTAATLVEYSSSDDDEPMNSSMTAQQCKKRKLPPVSSSLIVLMPVDNPALHQGRIRTTPHVDGQFAAHVYVSLILSRRSQLHKIIQDILCDAKQVVPSLHDIWPSEGPKRHELHVSLSRPIFLRAHQREDLKRAVKNIAQKQKTFDISFTVLSELRNDEGTRTFLTMEVGAGFHELQSLCTALAPTLKTIRQQEYYVDPKFHASIAWALLHQAKETSSDHDTPMTNSPPTKESIPCSSGPESDPITTLKNFPTIDCLPQDLIVTLNDKYGAKLSSPKLGTLVEAINLKIGKEKSTWKLPTSDSPCHVL